MASKLTMSLSQGSDRKKEKMEIELNKIYNEDCLIGMQRIPDGTVDAIITSPPYNFCLRIRGEKYTKRSPNETYMNSGNTANKYTNGLSDALDIEEYYEWQCKCIDEMLRICKGYVFYNIQIITGNKPAVLRILGKYAERIKEVLIWDKKTAEPAMGVGVLNSEYELIIVFANEDCKGRQFHNCNFERGTMSNVIRAHKNRGDGSHRAAFPVELPQILVGSFTHEGDTILDPFMGSGTTAIAAIREKRNFIGFELNKEYWEKANERIKNELIQGSLF